MAALRWRLDWEIAGYRGSVEDVEVRFMERAAFGPGAQNTRRADVSTVIPLDVRAIANQIPITYGRAVIWLNGTVVVSGAWMQPSYEPIAAGARSRVSFSVEESTGEDAGVWPPRSDFTLDRRPNDEIGYVNTWNLDAVGDPETSIFQREWIATPTWKDRTGNGYELLSETVDFRPVLRSDLGLDIPEPSEGSTLPYVFGTPGVTSPDDNGDTYYPGAPAYAYDESLALPVNYKLALTSIDCTGATAVAWAKDPEGVLGFSATAGTVAMETVAGFRRFAYISASDVTGTIVSDYSSTNVARRTHLGDSFYVSWTSAPSSGGAGDVLERCLSFSTLRVDVDSVAAARGYLNGYTLAGYLDEERSPADFVQSTIAPALNVTLALGPRGLRVVLPPWADGFDAAAPPLIQGQGISRVGRSVEYLQVQETRGVIVNYAVRADTGQPGRTTTASVFDTAYGTFGRAAQETTITCDFVASSSTANRIAREHAAIRSWTPRVVSYYVTDRDRYGIGGTHELLIGQRVRLTDSFLGFDAKAAFIGEIERGRTEIVTVYIIDDPIKGD